VILWAKVIVTTTLISTLLILGYGKYSELSLELKQSKDAIASIASSYHRQLQLQDDAIIERDMRNELLSDDLQKTMLRIRTIEANACFDANIPADVVKWVQDIGSEKRDMSKSPSEPVRADTTPTSTITCRDTTEWTGAYAEALERCNNQLRAINKLQQEWYTR
jgi:hypothetical protein